MENAVVVFETALPLLLVDPSCSATEWLKTHLKQSRVEVVNQQVCLPRFCVQIGDKVRFAMMIHA